MNCEDIMNSNLEFLPESASIETAAKLMADTGVGFLPICDMGGKAVGVVTDRDIATRAIAKRVPLDSTPVESIMSSPAITTLASANIREAEALMVEERKSRLVITDADGHVVGVVSLADLIEHAPAGQALRTAKAVLWREALGPRAGAARGEPLLQDDPVARAHAHDPPAKGHRDVEVTGGHHGVASLKEFP
jgi:CBS domain-containing protein